MWEGMFENEKVCVKVLRIYNAKTNNQKQALAVCNIRNSCVRFVGTDAIQAILRGSSCLEEAKTPKRCAFPGSNYDTIPTRVEVDA